MSEDNATSTAGSIANATVSQSKTELFIRSIPFEVTSTELSDFFSNVAPVKHAVVVTDHEGNSRGFGFVSFTDADDATKALEECRKQKLNDRLLKIDFAKPRVRGDDKESKPEKKPSSASVVEKRRPRLIVRNLPWSVRDPKQLEKIFAKFGNVTDVVIPRGDNGKMRGFAFVTMRKKSHADIAIEKTKNLKISGREVAVDFAVEKSKWLNNVKGTDEYDESESENESPKNEREEDGDDEDDDDENDENEDDDEELKDLEKQNFASPKVRLRGAPTSFTVFVRNVPYDATAESLKDHFEEFGEVRYALPVMDKQLNQPKGTAFVAFATEEARNECINNAPATATTSLLISDDVDPRYVFDGRVLAVTKAVERETATRLATASANERNKLLGKAPDEKDKRNLFLLNEGRITANSKLAEKIPASELEIRQKSYDLRKQQLNKNPSLHLSLTRLAIRNLPRAMSERALKALGRKAVVEFAKEVVEKKRQPLSKEEVLRSTKEKNSFGAVKSKHGVVRQSKIIMEQKGTGSLGRSRGYGFLEFRDHKAALMGLRWLNAHEVSIQEILEGVSEEEKKNLDLGDSKKRRLVVEFAIENAQVVKRRRENVMKSRAVGQKRKRDDSEAGDEEDDDNEEQEKDSKNKKAKNKKSGKKGNMNKGGKKKDVEEKSEPKSQEEVTRLVIGKKRKMRKLKKGK
jgi:nucleolar protein 4